MKKRADRIKVSTNVAIAAGVGGRRGRRRRAMKKRREAHANRASTWRVNAVGTGQVIVRLKLRTVVVHAVAARGVRHG